MKNKMECFVAAVALSAFLGTVTVAQASPGFRYEPSTLSNFGPNDTFGPTDFTVYFNTDPTVGVTESLEGIYNSPTSYDVLLDGTELMNGVSSVFISGPEDLLTVTGSGSYTGDVFTDEEISAAQFPPTMRGNYDGPVPAIAPEASSFVSFVVMLTSGALFFVTSRMRSRRVRS